MWRQFFWSLPILLVLAPAPLGAQIYVRAQTCTAANASVSNTTATVVVSGCSIAAGPKGVIFARAQGETLCGTTATEGVQLLAGSSAPTLGAAPPGGMTAMTPLLHQNGCNSKTLITSIAGAFVGTPGTSYYITMTLSTSDGTQPATWNNQTIKLLAF